jgi:hypothetical protein
MNTKEFHTMKQRVSASAVCLTLAVVATVAVIAGSPSSALRAQERTGHIYGRVVDGGGGVIVGATVTITDTLTGSTRQVTTNSEGSYSAPKLPTGTFTVTVTIALTKGKGLTERRRYTTCT